MFCNLDCLLQKSSVQKFDILKNAPLTAPLYVAESNREQIANLDAAIFRLCPDTQWFFYPPDPSRKNLKKHTHTKKMSKNLRNPFQTVHS